ncbi:MAG TPA: AAA family ATPase, partial [Rectinemataceae bacterium]|nr:AAA family ATPase [Rectinemataceae bacterium]
MSTTQIDFELAANVKELALILKGLAEDAPPELKEVARRLREGKLSGHDLLQVRAVASDYHEKVAGYVEAGVNPATMATVMARALSEGSSHSLGPDPGHKFGAAEVGEAIATLKAGEALHARALRLPKIITGRDLMAADYGPTRDTVEGLLPESGLVTLTAGKANGKTLLWMQGALAIGSGKPWLGRNTMQSKVIFIELELRPKTLQKRFMQMGVAEPVGVDFVSEWSKGEEAVRDLEAAFSLGYRVAILDV